MNSFVEASTMDSMSSLDGVALNSSMGSLDGVALNSSMGSLDGIALNSTISGHGVDELVGVRLEDELGHELEKAKRRAYTYANRLAMAEGSHGKTRVGSSSLIGNEDDYSIASENSGTSGTTNNTNCAVTTFPYVASRNDEPNNHRVQALIRNQKREITLLRTENMISIARNLALEQKMASFFEESSKGSVGAQEGMLSEREQVDEAFVRDCKDQLVEANLLAQDLRAELKTLRGQLECSEEECDALARLVQALSRKIMALDSASAESEAKGEQCSSASVAVEGGCLTIGDASIAALASDSGLSIIKHLVKGEGRASRGAPPSPRGGLHSPKEKKPSGNRTGPASSLMGLTGVVGSVLDDPPPPPRGSTSSPRQPRKDGEDAQGSPSSSSKPRPSGSPEPVQTKKKVSRAKQALKSAASAGGGGGAGDPSSARAAVKPRLKAALPSFRDNSGIRRSIKIVVPSGKQTTNAGASQPLRRRVAGASSSSSSSSSSSRNSSRNSSSNVGGGSALRGVSSRSGVPPNMATVPTTAAGAAAAAAAGSDDDTGSVDPYPQDLDLSLESDAGLGPEHAVFKDALAELRRPPSAPEPEEEVPEHTASSLSRARLKRTVPLRAWEGGQKKGAAKKR